MTPEIEQRLAELKALAQLTGEEWVWHRVATIFEGGHMMELMIAAYQDLLASDLIHDKTIEGDYSGHVGVSLEHDMWGGFHIDVALHGLEAGQITYVLEVARRHELEAREESGFLRLSPHLTTAEVEDEELEPEAVTA